jgi:hypothetical protein
MAGVGAKAVLIENRVTAWTYTYTPSGEVQTLTPTGQEIVAANADQSRGCRTPSLNGTR